MSGELPSEKIKAKLNIEDVVSSYVQLQRSGNSLKAICPFHNENSPSFFVSTEKQIFNCFGCGKGGDMFKFIMEIEGIEFKDALRMLAKKAGVELKRVDPEIATERSIVQDICVDSARFFYKNLNSDSGVDALKYLEKRGLKKETIDEFRIGYSLSSWDSLYNFLRLKSYPSDKIEKAGLVIKSRKYKNRYFDRFRDRVMFPILDVNSYIVGFTGRYLKIKENEGKYVNSPQTLIFDKSSVLYNLEKAKLHIKKNDFVLLVEGQMDVILLWQDGIKNVVASSGTALTQKQINLFGRYSKNIKIAFDVDDAGDLATKRGINLLLDEGFNVEVVQVPDGKDPADFVLDNPGKFDDLLKSSLSVMEYFFKTALSKYDKNNLNDKKKIAELILPNIKKIKNSIERYHWLDKLAQVLNLDIKYLETELKEIKRDSPASIEKNAFLVKEEKIYDKIFSSLLAFLLKSPSDFVVLEERKLSEVLKDNSDDITVYISDDILDLFDFFVKCGKMGQISDVLDKADKKQKKTLNSIVVQSDLIDDSLDFKAEIIFLIDNILSELTKVKRAALIKKIKDAEAKNDQNAVSMYLEELNNNIIKYGK